MAADHGGDDGHAGHGAPVVRDEPGETDGVLQKYRSKYRSSLLHYLDPSCDAEPRERQGAALLEVEELVDVVHLTSAPVDHSLATGGASVQTDDIVSVQSCAPTPGACRRPGRRTRPARGACRGRVVDVSWG